MIVLDQTSSAKADSSFSIVSAASTSRLFRSSSVRRAAAPSTRAPQQQTQTKRLHQLCHAALFSQHHHHPTAWSSPLQVQSALSLPLAATTTTTMIATTGSGSAVGFFKLLTAFVLGGLFFSTAIAAVSAVYAVGYQNVKVLWDVVKAVLQAVWVSFTAALSAAKAALVLSSSSSSSSSIFHRGYLLLSRRCKFVASMGLAHSVKVSLGLLDTSRDLAFPRFGSMTLTHPLGLYNLGAALDATVPTLVFGGFWDGVKRVHHCFVLFCFIGCCVNL
uniref:Uncharacterized protein n=1 Tax=Amphora coffeiformis TaxID=265554 RepID=A0A7S3L0T0_9STRA